MSTSFFIPPPVGLHQRLQHKSSHFAKNGNTQINTPTNVSVTNANLLQAKSAGWAQSRQTYKQKFDSLYWWQSEIFIKGKE